MTTGMFSGLGQDAVVRVVASHDGVSDNAVYALLEAKKAMRMRSGVWTSEAHTVEPCKGFKLEMLLPWSKRRRGELRARWHRSVVFEFPKGILCVKVDQSVDVHEARIRVRSFRKRGAKKVRRHNGMQCVTLWAAGDHAWVGKTVQAVRELLAPMRVVREQKTVGRKIHMLTAGSRGFRLKPIAAFEDSLERNNYTAEVLAQYDSAVQTLRSNDPSGRLVILRGPPGTGKTYMVRGMIEAIHEVRFVLIPAHMLPAFTQPALANMLVRLRGPTCLVIEDADQLLIERGADNVPSVAALLSIADGLFGEIADVRMICSTNANKLNFDRAIVRAERLIENIEVPALGEPHASEIYRRLTDGAAGPRWPKTVTLADVYKAARKPGQIPEGPRPATPTIGFNQVVPEAMLAAARGCMINGG